MKRHIKNDIPSFYLEDSDTKLYVDVIDDCHNILYNQITDLIVCKDFVNNTEKFVDLIRLEKRFNPKINLSLEKKRMLIAENNRYYNFIGSQQGIITTVKELLDVDIKFYNGIDDSFKIGFSKIGGDDRIGTEYYMSVSIINYRPADVGKLDDIKTIVNYMRLGVAYFEYIQKDF